MFPSLPYHNLAVAHDYLMIQLPDDSPYRDLVQPGWWSVAKKMLQPDSGKRTVRLPQPHALKNHSSDTRERACNLPDD